VAHLPTNITTAKKSACKTRKTFPEPEGGKSGALIPSNRPLYLVNRTNKTSAMPDNHAPKAQWFSPSVTASENVRMPLNKEIIVINQSGALRDAIVSLSTFSMVASAACASALDI
tara:strand:- start:136 stop:480 length:345 start_codon:yes stop_codon:yes gene_type:complete